LAAVAALNYVVVELSAPGFGGRTLIVDLAGAVFAILVTLWLTARYEAGVKRIASGLSEVARGRRDLRFDVDREPLVARLAHAANEALVALAEPVDPAVGPVRVRKRGTSDPRSPAVHGDDSADASRPGRANGLGRASATKNTPVPTSSGRLVALGDERARFGSDDPAAKTEPPHPSMVSPLGSGPLLAMDDRAEPGLPPPGLLAAQPRTLSTPPILAPAPGADFGTPARGTSIPDAITRAEHYRNIFEEYRASLARIGETDGDLTLDGFVATLSTTERALVEKHGCRTVRFSILVEDGRVQLLPRLVR
jgi:hypothetical protein